MTEKRTYSYTQIDCFNRCHLRWFWTYHEDLTPRGKSIPLQVGTLVHVFTDLYTQERLTLEHITHLPECLAEMYPNNTHEEHVETAHEVSRLVQGYVNYWENDDLKIVSPEMHLVWEGPEYDLYSRLDALAMDSLGHWRLERKTTSRMDGHWLKGMKSGLQSGIAHWLLEELMPDVKIRGSVFDLIAKTKIPQYQRSFVPMQPWRVAFAKKTIEGVHQDIENENFYPSIDCFKYNKECEYAILCRNDSERNREAFFETRKEAKDREKEMMSKYFGLEH